MFIAAVSVYKHIEQIEINDATIPNSETSSRSGKGENLGSRAGLTICVEVQLNASGNKEITGVKSVTLTPDARFLLKGRVGLDPKFWPSDKGTVPSNCKTARDSNVVTLRH